MSLLLGLVAALAWGIHDVSVRKVSQTGSLIAPLFWVLAIGTALVLILWPLVGGGVPRGGAARDALAAGALFGLGGAALYKAFSIGPVRLVAPTIGAYPILSMLFALAAGTPVTAWQWLAVLAVVAGIGLVASGADEGDAAHGSRVSAILWSLAAGAGFAASFALGQEASHGGGGLGPLAVTRLAACAAVLALAALLRQSLRPPPGALPLLALMGTCDAIALGAVLAAGNLARPEFASVAAAMFGLVTVVLAWAILRERMTARQWAGVALAFGAIGWLSI